MIIETQRLLIRPLVEEDAIRFAQYRDKPEVSKYQSWHHYSLNDAKRRIHYCLKHPFDGRKGNTQLAITLKENQMLIGDLHVEVMGSHYFSIGYTLDSPYWHQGYAREAVKGLIAYMRDVHSYTKCMAYIYTGNEKSRALLLALGFHKFDESAFYDDEGYILDLTR